MKTQGTELGASPGPQADISPLPFQDFLLQQDNLLDHLVPAEAREDEVETTEQHREAGTTRVDSVRSSSLRPCCSSTVARKLMSGKLTVWSYLSIHHALLVLRTIDMQDTVA